MRIDHVILMTRDLDAAAARLGSTHDLGSVVGGQHPAWGTANRIVPAGESYLEIMGVDDDEVAAGNDLGRFVLDATTDGDRLTLVCLRPDDLSATCHWLGLEVEERTRVTPEGVTLTWRMAGLDRALRDGVPFFIAWDGPSGADVPDPDNGARATGIARVDLGGDPDALREHIGADVPDLHLVGGDRGVRAVTLTTPAGDVVLRG